METNQGFMLRARRTGYTTWMLKSAINNPDCIIVGANQQHCRHLEKRYYKLLKEESFFKKVLRRIKKTKNPTFISMRDGETHGLLGKPRIYDNFALMKLLDNCIE